MANAVNNSTERKSIRDAVLAKIRTGQAKMRPRWHFVLKALLVFFGLVIGFLTLLYLTSFTVFMLRQSGVWFIPIFGFRGVMMLFASLPWLLILAGISFVILLEILVRRYSFAYRKPLLYSLLGIIAFTVLANSVVARTGFHEKFFMRAREGKLPIAGGWYRDFGLAKSQNVHPGTVIEITEDGFRMENRRGETLTVIISPETRFPLGIDFQKGDQVVVLGERDNDHIGALGIRRVDSESHRPFKRPGWPKPDFRMKVK